MRPITSFALACPECGNLIPQGKVVSSDESSRLQVQCEHCAYEQTRDVPTTVLSSLEASAPPVRMMTPVALPPISAVQSRTPKRTRLDAVVMSAVMLALWLSAGLMGVLQINATAASEEWWAWAIAGGACLFCALVFARGLRHFWREAQSQL